MREARELSDMAISGIAWEKDGFGIGVAFPGSYSSWQSFGLFLDGSTIGSVFAVSHSILWCAGDLGMTSMLQP